MTNKVTYLNDGEFCMIKKDHIEFFSEDGNKINKKVIELSSEEEKYDKGDYKHFMAKEIEEQPSTLKNGITCVLFDCCFWFGFAEKRPPFFRLSRTFR